MLHERIKERRQALGLSLSDIASKLGVRESTALRYESGEIRNIKHKTIVGLADALKCTPEYLMGWENDSLEYVAEQQSANKKIDALVKVVMNMPEDDLDILLAMANRMSGNIE